MISKNNFTIQKLKSVILFFTVALMLSACGGGEQTTSQQNTNTPSGAQVGCGALDPAPATSDINSFCNEFWSKSNLQNNCATCHKADQAPLFMRDDDINIAYSETNQLSSANPSKYIVDVNNPTQSYILDKVLGGPQEGDGHNCWATDQVCADLILAYIENWVGETAGSSKTIPLTAPANTAPPGGGKEFPANATTPSGSSFQELIYNPILIPYCATCHDNGPGDPLFAGSNVETSYLLSQPRMNLDDPSSSRFVTKLLTHTQGCWTVNNTEFPDVTLTGDSCTDSSAAMADAITKFAANLPSNVVDPSIYIISDAMKITDGIVASGGSRFEANQIALYEFKSGQGTTAYDTSGSGTALDLTFSQNGNVSWVGGWGVSINGAGDNLQSSSTNRKLYDLIQLTGEYSIEAWVAPNNVTQENARIVNYSGGGGDKNFGLSQTLYNYDAQARNSNTGLDGEPAVSTPDADEVLQATLQHVVTTYDPVNGRQTYVNGVLRASGDPQAGGALDNWNNTYSLVLGDERGANNDNNLWKGTIKLVSIHNRSLNTSQIQQNFVAGVGEKFFLLFDISHIPGVPAQSYIMFLVSQYDNYSYLFTDPKYVNLDSGITSVNIPVKGMRIGVNSKESPAGQAYINLDTVITSNNQALSSVGTTIALEKGSAQDEFYLIFEALGSESRTYTEPTYTAQVPPDVPGGASDIGIKTFDEINETMSAMTGVNKQLVTATYDLVKQQLPASPDINTFVTTHNIGATQLAMSYCDVLVNDATGGNTGTLFGSYNFNQTASTAFANNTSKALIIDPLLAATNGIGMDTQIDVGSYAEGGTVPDATGDTFTTKSELIHLIDNLCGGAGACTNTAQQTQLITKAVCTAALAGANTIIQ